MSTRPSGRASIRDRGRQRRRAAQGQIQRDGPGPVPGLRERPPSSAGTLCSGDRLAAVRVLRRPWGNLVGRRSAQNTTFQPLDGGPLPGSPVQTRPHSRWIWLCGSTPLPTRSRSKPC